MKPGLQLIAWTSLVLVFWALLHSQILFRLSKEWEEVIATVSPFRRRNVHSNYAWQNKWSIVHVRRFPAY